MPSWIKINPPVFIASTSLIVLLALAAVFFPIQLDAIFSKVQHEIIQNLSWFYVLTVALILITIIYLCLSKAGDIRLGPDHAEPDFSYLSWFSMLFSAGMGIGLVFFGVAEPVMHFLEPPSAMAGTAAAAREAMQITFFHWGFHAWGIYAMVALILAYFSFRHDLPLTLRSAFYPLFGKKIHGSLGHAVDSFAIIGTVFGVATSLGYGVVQINAGLDYMFGISQSIPTQVILVIIITLIATTSVASGLEKGIKRLSEFNIFLGVALLLFFTLLGPTSFLLESFLQNTGNYLSELVSKTFNLYAYEPTDWLGGWTLLYWAWWLSWSPFVGMFIARISWGRTIREFILGVMLVPVGFTLLWVTIFGGSAIHEILFDGVNSLAVAVQNDIAVALFQFFEHYPFPKLLSGLGIVMIVVFFVTSSDSGAMVIDMLASGGDDETPTWQRIYWALLVGVIAATLLLAGGLSALQTATIISALPFSVIILTAMYGLIKAINIDTLKRQSLKDAMPRTGYGNGKHAWRDRIENILDLPAAEQIKDFIEDIAAPALHDVAKELEGRGVKAQVASKENKVTLIVPCGDDQAFEYGVRPRRYEPPAFILSQMRKHHGKLPKTHVRAERFLADGSEGHDLSGYSREALINDVIDQYESHLHFIRLLYE